MTSPEAYQRFLQKINKGNTGDNPSIEIGVFVLIYNEEQNRWFFDQFRDATTDKLYRISELRMPSQELTNGIVKPDYVEYSLPTGFYRIDSGIAYCSKGKCKEQPVYIDELKSRNKSVHLFDDNARSSFEFEWTFCTFSTSNTIQVYKTDFTIDKILLDYYRFPRNIDIAGYEHVNGTQSTTINPELEDYYVDQVINRCATEFMRNFLSGQDVEIAKTRTITEN